MTTEVKNSATSGGAVMSYEQTAADPRIPVVTKDDYIEYLEQQLTDFRKTVRKAILKLVDSYGNLP